MNLQRPTRTTITLSLCTATLAAAVLYEHSRLSDLSTVLNGSADQAFLDTVQSRLSRTEERLEDGDKTATILNDNIRTAQLALSRRMDAVEAQAKDSFQTLSPLLFAPQDLVMLKASVEALDIRLTNFQQAHPVGEKAPTKSSISSLSRLPPKSKAKLTPPPSPQSASNLAAVNSFSQSHRSAELACIRFS